MAVGAQPRARGVARLVAKARAGTSVIRDLHQAGSAKLVFPRADFGLQAVLVNTAGGITGGDRFDLTFEAEAGTHLTLTTQAAERAYGAQQAETGRLTTHLTVGAGARINWLPQETILFERCRYARAMRIDMAANARLLFVEPLVFGRTAMGETLTDIDFADRVEMYRAGTPLFCDAMNIRGDAVDHLGRVAGHAAALASVVYIAPDAAAHLDAIRAMLPEAAGASLIGDDLLHIRLLASDSFLLRQTLMPILVRLGETSLPRAWMI